VHTTIDDAIAFCYNSRNNKIYDAGYYDDSVVVIGGSTNSVLASVPNGSGPRALCYNPTNNKVYCANEFSGDVTVIDGATNSVLATVVVGDEPCALCYDPQDNRVYCANRYSNDVTVIDGATNGVVTTVAVGAGPCAFACNPVQNRVYVANYGGSSISVLRDTTVGIEDMPYVEARVSNSATVVRRVLMIGDREQKTADRAELLDISGCKVLDLRPGSNDVRALAPGVYFVCPEPSAVGRQPSAVAKVVIAR
jgi:YVTN family beta-propeller protein